MTRFLFGFVSGCALTAAMFLLFGDTIRGRVVSTTRDVGERVQEMGETLERSADELRRR